MHISEGVLTGPTVVVTNVLGAVVVAWGARAMNRFVKQQPNRKPLLGMAGAFIFFVSLIHIPAFSGTTCSHPCGTPLAAILLGPGVAAALAFLSLILQALFFAHGGIMTLGANTLTLGLVGAGSGWLTYKVCRKLGLSLWVSAALGGLVGDVLTYALNVLILSTQFALVAPHPVYSFGGYCKVLVLAYLPVQGPIAILEMFFTGFAIHSIARQRPEVLEDLHVDFRGMGGKAAKAVVGVLLVLGLLAAGRQVMAAENVASAVPAAAVTPATTPMTFAGLDDSSEIMSKQAGIIPHKPYLDFESWGDLWNTMLMFAGLIPGFIIGRWWYLLFGADKEAKMPAKKARA